jgi:hypothetical protein
MDRPNTATGDSAERKPSAELTGGAKFSHLNEQLVDSLRRENFHEITPDDDAGGPAGHRRQPPAPDGSHSNEPASRRDGSQTAAAAQAAGARAKWPDWVRASALPVKPEFEPDSSWREKGAHAAADRPGDSERQSGPAACLKRLMKMIKNHYLITLTGLSLVIFACLLASVAISRSIGEHDLEADTTKDGGRQLKESLVDPLELRTIELVDLTECGKTFAYARWRVQVLVPKSRAIYKQHARPPPDGLDSPPTASAKAGLPDLAGETSDVQQAHGNQTDNGPGPATIDGGVPGAQSANSSASRTGREDASAARPANQQVPNQRSDGEPMAAAAAEEQEEDGAYSSADPLELAANEMSIELNDMNSTLVDCFLVDTEKRLEQKRTIERRHKQEALTRRVNLKSMLATIQACRSLTLSSLSEQTASDKRAPPGGRADGGPTTSEHKAGAPNLGNANAKGPTVATSRRPTQTENRRVRALDQEIRPVERPLSRTTREQRRPPAANNQSSFGSFIETLIGTLSNSGTSGVARSPGADLHETGAGARPTTAGNVRLEPPAMLAQSGHLRRADQNSLLVATNSDTELAGDGEDAQRASYINMGMSMISGIVPNTLWCGLGDRASNYSELGSEFQLDACCRAHDHCPIRLRPFSADYQLINWSMSTRSHCDCDLDFDQCLTALNTTLSNVIKTLYFRFVGLQCLDVQGRRQNAVEPVGQSS